MKGDIAVSVDRDFARFGSKSYAINKINTVEVRKRHPHGQGAMFVFGLLALVSLLGGPPGIALALLFGGLAVWFWQRSRIIEYQLFLMTSSSEAQAISSRDGAMIQGLRNRIEDAIAGRLT